MFLIEVCKNLKNNKIPYAIVGGHAVALHGAVRGTLDIDMIIDWKEEYLQKVQQIFEEMGLVSRVPLKAKEVFVFREEYIKNKNLFAWNFFNPKDPSQQVDIVITHGLAHFNTQNIQTSLGDITILDKSGLIKMKLDAGRPQDIEDIKALRELEK